MSGKIRVVVCLAVVALTTFTTACGGGGDAIGSITETIASTVMNEPHATVAADDGASNRDSSPVVLEDEAPGTDTFGDNGATVDYSNVDQGYVMVKYEGDNKKIKVRVTNTGSEDGPYTYDLDPDNGYEALPISLGDGDYEVAVYTNIEADKYAVAAQDTVSVKLEDEFLPFLRPSQYVNYTADSECVAKAAELAADGTSDLAVAEQIFLYVVDNVAYDYDKAETVQSGYLPDVDETLATGKGICFDYAALTTAMLRSQGIPSKLIVGYAGSAYHSWIGIYSRESGEFAAIIEFKGDKYNLADPTFTASGDNADPNVIGDGDKYQPLYYY